ncbi:hypothetical protein MPTK1_5g19700 [Marchantia polymorpha subsp. ruderalis]|uniref:Uncharacterized protein n=2 Tax=Marchantia polymorpha TaxID=3197 RepID=A0AAF6BK58_MARPO|nr:hypothetical protein MARPO_0134s0028 [Marchantia polymorpha]BBN12392.1 hypothetical protein Mp_5g19700 [Marchantia polymorpha subsp. ruderalis]|eukprot:PTQ29817.1 hypothetical protein MARPO_0134s0028 [Marchantia polymorpha]
MDSFSAHGSLGTCKYGDRFQGATWWHPSCSQDPERDSGCSTTSKSKFDSFTDSPMYLSYIHVVGFPSTRFR